MIILILCVLAAVGFIATGYLFANMGSDGQVLVASFVSGFLWKTLFLAVLFVTALLAWKLFGRLRSASARLEKDRRIERH